MARSLPATVAMRRPNVPPPSWMPSGNRGFRIDARRAIIPFSLGTLAVLAFGLRVPWTILVPLSLVVPAFYAWSAWYVHRSLRPFEMRFNALLTSGDVDGLWCHYRDARLLRWLAPEWIMRAKLGLILTLREDFRAANVVLEDAYELAPKQRRADLLGPLARSKYALGDFEALQAVAREWRRHSLFPGAANVYLAAAFVEDPREDTGQAREVLDEIKGGLSDSEEAIRAEIESALGE